MVKWGAWVCLLHQEAKASYTPGINTPPFPTLVPYCWGGQQEVSICTIEVKMAQGEVLLWGMQVGVKKVTASLTWKRSQLVRGWTHEKSTKAWKVDGLFWKSTWSCLAWDHIIPGNKELSLWHQIMGAGPVCSGVLSVAITWVQQPWGLQQIAWLQRIKL